MILAKVTGNIVSTEKHEAYTAQRLLVLHPVDNKGKSTGPSFIAVDSVSAGPGELVLVVDEGNSARSILDMPGAPIRCVVCAIVDSLDFGAAKFAKSEVKS